MKKLTLLLLPTVAFAQQTTIQPQSKQSEPITIKKVNDLKTPPAPPAGLQAAPIPTNAPNIEAATKKSVEANYLTNKDATLKNKDKRALAVSKRYQNSNKVDVMPVATKGGSVTFIYGIQQPTVVCAVFQVCTISLQPGEQIVDKPHLGDIRWNIDPAVSGVGSAQIQNIVVKPTDTGLDTTLMIFTDRRTYNIRLKSTRDHYMPMINFSYPDEDQAKWAALKRQESIEQEKRRIPETNEYIGNLNFDYSVTGSAGWKPIRVYNDGRKTIIQMPSKMNQTEAPVLLVIRKNGDESLVNYRLQADRFIVDSIFDKAILVAGVGSNQEKVTITKGTK